MSTPPLRCSVAVRVTDPAKGRVMVVAEVRVLGFLPAAVLLLPDVVGMVAVVWSLEVGCKFSSFRNLAKTAQLVRYLPPGQVDGKALATVRSLPVLAVPGRRSFAGWTWRFSGTATSAPRTNWLSDPTTARHAPYVPGCSARL